MKKRYTEEQIIGFLKEAEAARRLKGRAAGTVLPKPAITPGVISLADGGLGREAPEGA